MRGFYGQIYCTRCHTQQSKSVNAYKTIKYGSRLGERIVRYPLCSLCFKKWQGIFSKKFGEYTPERNREIVSAFLEFIFGNEQFVFR